MLNLTMSEGMVEGVLPNSSYVEDQRHILRNIHVGPADEILPPHLYEPIKNGLSQPENCLTDENGTKVFTRMGFNGIMTVQESVPLQYGSYPLLDEAMQETGSSADYYGKEIRVVRGYYIIDTITGKAFDVMSLWSKETYDKSPNEPVYLGDTFSILVPIDANEGVFTCNDSCNIIILPDLSKSGNQPKTSGDKKFFDTRSTTVPFHEIGHSVQQNGSKREGLSQVLTTIGMRFPFLLDLVKLYSPAKQALEKEKRYKKVIERNAEAFSLSVVRILKQQGLDVMRGISYKDLRDYSETGLSSYDKVFRKYSTDAVSNTVRNKARKKSGYIQKIKTSLFAVR